ncbi:MAG TPA: hypothetical protein VLZ06_12180 [Solirubrobacteraceae bacterium]|nr:hypothetical protein [Solirubrobacteraceae bacterium]
MGTTEVQRTLVKSPPELWAELSDQDALARHLSELGEIRITSTVTETAVYWEGPDTTGSAHITQAGWGTKVTLTATPAAVAPGAAAAEDAPAVVSAASAAHDPPADPPTPLTAAAQRAVAEPSAGAEATNPVDDAGAATGVEPDCDRPGAAEGDGSQPGTPEHEAGEPSAPEHQASEPPAAETVAAEPGLPEPTGAEPEQTRRGFFSRLLGRRFRERDHDGRPPVARSEPPVAEPPLAEPPVTEPPVTEPPRNVEAVQTSALDALQARFAARPYTPPVPPEPPNAPPEPANARPEPAQPPLPEPAAEPSLSSQLRCAEEVAPEKVRATPTEDQIKEILSGVLDRLGSAHHRPFSRA